MEEYPELMKRNDTSILEREGESEEVDLSSRSMGLGVFKDTKPPKYMKYKEFLNRRDLTELFNLKNQKMEKFIREKLLRLKPREDGADVPGWVYCYYRKLDKDMIAAKKLSHLILYKVGRTKNHPQRRI
jgi:hypothetical protein